MVYMGMDWGLGFHGLGLGFFFYFLITNFRWTGSFDCDACATTFYDSLLGYSSITAM
jgi:hypothetical protein